MKLFVLFLFTCAIASLMLQKRGKAPTILALLGICVCVVFGYFFLNQI